jgi:hypothetical protein
MIKYKIKINSDNNLITNKVFPDASLWAMCIHPILVLFVGCTSSRLASTSWVLGGLRCHDAVRRPRGSEESRRR